MDKITIIEISFNNSLKQYKYLLKGEADLKIGRQYKMIKGISRGSLIYDIITVKTFYQVDALPDIVTKYLEFQNTKVISTLISTEYKRQLTKVISGQPKIPTHYWFFWQINTEDFLEEKATFTTHIHANNAFFLLKKCNWILTTTQQFDCSDFLARTPSINLEDVKKYQKIAQENL